MALPEPIATVMSRGGALSPSRSEPDPTTVSSVRGRRPAPVAEPDPALAHTGPLTSVIAMLPDETARCSGPARPRDADAAGPGRDVDGHRGRHMDDEPGRRSPGTGRAAGTRAVIRMVWRRTVWCTPTDGLPNTHDISPPTVTWPGCPAPA